MKKDHTTGAIHPGDKESGVIGGKKGMVERRAFLIAVHSVLLEKKGTGQRTG